MIGFSSISFSDFRELVVGANQYRANYELPPGASFTKRLE